MTMYKLYYDESDWNVASGGNSGDVSSAVVREPLASIRIAILGDYAVGKTCLIRRVCRGDFDTVHKTTMTVDRYQTTIGVENGARKLNLELYDTPSIDRYKNNVEKFHQSCHAAVIVFDTTEPYSFQNITNHMDAVRRSFPPYAELFLVGTKSDMTQERKVTFKEADVLATKNNLSLFETSSKTNSNVRETFRRIAELTWERFEIGTFDPATLIIPPLPNIKLQIGRNGERGVTANSVIRPYWSLFCCWL